ncbi:uncharacterized protein LOC126849278 [Cataglyphis hispanica]|uniref:uncharacterized protein LOC126849278 n=1 Tax=Cataglyphis hispanica TaxID=1086592 RepID=UPI00218007D4|nr:uncharacterized protein LOC126849278 [Cataglyphis hispanica]
MKEGKLINISDQEEISIMTSCWYCNEDGNKGKLISPCKCTNQLIHLHCLKISANIWNVLYCQFCQTQYSLEIKHKSLLECYRGSSTLFQMLREVCAPLFKILILIFYYLFFVSIIVYVIISYDYVMKDYNIFIVIFIIIMYLYGLFFFIYATVPIMINWSDRIRKIYYKSTQEIILMKQHPNVQII